MFRRYFSTSNKYFSVSSSHGSSTSPINPTGAKKILDTYADKIRFKAKQEGLSVNNLIEKNVPKDEVLQVRNLEKKVSNWRSTYNRSKGTSVFVQIPWLADDKVKERQELKERQDREDLEQRQQRESLVGEDAIAKKG